MLNFKIILSKYIALFIAIIFFKCASAQMQIFAPFLNDKQSLNNFTKSLAPQLLSQSSGNRFIENKGQIVDTKGHPRPDIKYYTECVNGVQMYFAKDKISYVFPKYDTTQLNEMSSPFERRLFAKSGRVREHVSELYRMDMNILNAAPTSIECDGESSDYTNYYYAHCPNGILNIHSYSLITYKNIYPNIDLVYYPKEQGIEYNFIVNPGGHVGDIQLQYDGASDMAITSEGNIRITNPLGTIEEKAPNTYQSEPINSIFSLQNKILSFNIDNYDHTQILIIVLRFYFARFMEAVRKMKVVAYALIVTIIL